MDDLTRQFLVTFQTFLDDVVPLARGAGRPGQRSIVEEVAEHLGTDPHSLPVVSEEVAAHQLVNLDVAMELLLAQQGGGRVIGIGGGERRQHHSFLRADGVG